MKSPSWTNAPRGRGFGGFLLAIPGQMRLVPPLVRYTRVATFAHMRLGMVWLVIRPLFMIAATAVLALNVVRGTGGVGGLSAIILGVGFWYSFYRCLMHLGRAPHRLRRITREYSAVSRVVFVMSGFGPAAVEVTIIAGVSVLLYSLAVIHQQGVFINDIGRLWLLPLTIAIMLTFAVALSVMVSHLVDRVRDVWYFYKYILTGLMLGTPILYPLSILPPEIERYVWLNPFVGAVEGFRAGFLDTSVNGPALAYSAAVSLAFITLSMFVSFRFEKRNMPLAELEEQQ